jgi:hypothetical protein
MTDQSGIRDRDETSRDVFRRTRDEPVTGVEDGCIEIVDPSPMLRRLIETAQQLNEEELRKLLLRGWRMLRGTEE